MSIRRRAIAIVSLIGILGILLDGVVCRARAQGAAASEPEFGDGPEFGEQPDPSLPQGSAGPRSEQRSPSGASREELELRMKLMQKSMGFGGIFAPLIAPLGKGGGSPSDGCARYKEYAARQACKAGDGWAADRLERKESSGSERDWYNR
jgi:hypothetical protein